MNTRPTGASAATAPAPVSAIASSTARSGGDHFAFVLDDVISCDGLILTRIRATRDLPVHNVRTGDLGGYLECADNLGDEAWVADAACVFDAARLRERARASGTARVFRSVLSGTARVLDRAIVGPGSHMRGNAYAFGSAQIIGTTLSGNVRVGCGTILGERLSDLRFQTYPGVPRPDRS